jgi:hypothetical protein
VSHNLDIVNTKDTRWNIILDNVVSSDNLGSKFANAVPAHADESKLLDSHGPNVQRISYQRRHKHPVDDHPSVEFAIDLKWTYGARYKGGGAYIPKVWTEVPMHNVGAGWHVNIRALCAELPYIEHEKAPVAMLPLFILGEVIVKDVIQLVEWNIMIYGDGNLDFDSRND